MGPAERIRLVPLSATGEGEAVEFTRLPLSVGSGPDADVHVPAAAARHCLVFEREGDVVVLDSGSGRGTRVAGRAVAEAVLRDGDVIELGEGGPRLRFAREDRRKGRRLADRATLRLPGGRVARHVAAAAAVVAVAALFALGGSWRESRRLRGEVTTLRRAVQSADAGRRGLESRIEEERRRAAGDREHLRDRLAEFRSREEQLRTALQDAAGTEVQGLREELTATRGRIQALEAERAAGENVIRRYGAGVCLIQGSYAYDDAEGRPLRLPRRSRAEPPAGEEAADAANLTPEGDGAVHTVDYYGTGFLVEGGGLILTNRHLAEPWWNDETAEGLQEAGYRPKLVSLRVFFPEQREPFVARVERRSDTVDLALLRVDLAGSRVPVLPLDRSRAGAVAGQPVVVLGYPAGLEAILAKAETSVVQHILETHGASSDRVTEALSLRGLIRPSTTQGHIGDITVSDVVYDAPTTQGGSGGPVFNKHGEVIAVEYAVLPRFGGNSFGVPIAYALELLSRGGRPRG
jgi:S1-C subfamily serine protease